MEHAATWAPRALRLGCEFFIEANQEQEKLRTLQVNMAHLNGL
jgi:predicted small metal-binding protein